MQRHRTANVFSWLRSSGTVNAPADVESRTPQLRVAVQVRNHMAIFFQWPQGPWEASSSPKRVYRLP